MSVYDIGDYRVQQLNTCWRISWQSLGGNRHHLDMDLPSILYQHIEVHLEKICYLISLMENNSPEVLLDNDLGFQIIVAMPESDTIPGEHLQPHEIKQWHREQLLKGYNRSNNTQFTYDMIRDRLP